MNIIANRRERKNHSPLEEVVEKDSFGVRLNHPHPAERQTTTPPLRGSRRGRAIFAKADSVGGESRFIATPSYTPHQFTFGLTPSVH
ncbi:MAG: hypothetical protein OXE44_14260, partial [Nitrospinae bacterium]|nr:hypothetical protein [Nitrospinota bacterium]